MNTPTISPNDKKNFRWSLFRDFLFLLTAIFESTILFVFFWRKRSNGRDFEVGESDDEVYSDEEDFFNEIETELANTDEDVIESQPKDTEEFKEEDSMAIEDSIDSEHKLLDKNESNDDFNSLKDESFKDLDFDTLDSFINDNNHSETSVVDEKSKLLEALGDFSFGVDDSNSDTSSNSSDSDSSDQEEDVMDEEEEDVEEDADSPLLKEYSVSEATNKAGLRRAKKKVITGLKKGHYQMEDVHVCSYPWEDNENLSLFCIFDGHSGRECADAAKEIVPKLLKEKIDALEVNDETDLEPILKNVFKEADEKMIEFEYEGSTATVMPLWKIGKNRYFQVANVGDSSAVIVTSDGKAEQLTVDHRPSVKSEKERLEKMGIILNEGQNRLNGLAVSRALGDHFPKSVECGLIAEPDVSKVIKITKKHKMIIIASDGLWDVVTDRKSVV